jgi:hypothetical protein
VLRSRQHRLANQLVVSTTNIDSLTCKWFSRAATESIPVRATGRPVGGWSSTTKTPHVTLRPKHRNGKGIDVSQESREINSGASGARNSGEGKTHLLFRVASGLKSIHPASLWQGTPRRFLPLLGDGRARPSLSCMRPASFTHTHTLGPAPTCALMLAAANGPAASSKRGLRCSVARSQMRLHCSAMHFNGLDNVTKTPSIAFETVFSRDRLSEVKAR